MIDALLTNIAQKGVELTRDEQAFVASVYQPKKLRKRQFILQQGDVAKYETFIVKGLTRTYLVDEDGREHIIAFGAEDWWTGDMASFFNSAPTSYFVDCLEETDVLQISQANLERLFVTVPKMNIYFRILYSNSIVAYNIRVALSLCKPAVERYQEFISRYPKIQQRLPNHQIASYLGITPQSLSRLRKLAVLPK
ncbi:Crp/Fnr family transcriptional regulator [Mucilaginibacter antarcticus]|uniref:Crp/Fnr family transcriptional regulator n=1 Tax=Mucilaginibacter antarcticus TaxID=1855725 RepID=A0ABW5XPG7_9SPHI